MVWKLVLPWGCTEAAVPSGRWRPSLEAGGSAPKEVQVGGLGEAQSKLHQLHGGEERI